jgi:hypothetical protein
MAPPLPLSHALLAAPELGPPPPPAELEPDPLPAAPPRRCACSACGKPSAAAAFLKSSVELGSGPTGYGSQWQIVPKHFLLELDAHTQNPHLALRVH